MATEKRLVYAEEVMALICGMDSLPWEESAQEMVESLTTVDAIEVVHGRWLPVENWNECICSCCNHKYVGFFASYWNYCPNCGAKKDGGADNV